MPSCVHCGNALGCTNSSCKKEQPIGQTAINCPQLAKGRLWIHVVDDVGVNIPGVPVSGSSKQVTDSTGMWKFEQLEPRGYTATMDPSKANLDAYDVPKDVPLTKQVQVKAGILAYVMFELIRKAKLKVRIVVKSGANLEIESLLDTVAIPVTAAYTGNGAQAKEVSKSSAKGLVNFEGLSAGKYKLTPTFTSLAKEDYEYVEGPKEIDLLPNDNKEIVFEVNRKAKLTVQFFLKACGPKFKDDLPFKTTAIQVTAEPKANGSKDSQRTTEGQALLKLLPSSYTVKPDFSVLDDKLFEWKSEPKDTDVVGDDDKPLIFELGRKAKLKVKIVYKHDRDHHLRDAEDGVVPIKLKFLGNDFKPASDLQPVNTKEGVAEFASLSPGKYEITPDFGNLAKCKFDYTLETRTVEIFPDVDEPVIFDVEPLYQKVHFIGHTLLAIPTQVYVEHKEDADKLKITKNSDGTRKVEIVTNRVKKTFTKNDFEDALAEKKAKFTGIGKLKLQFLRNERDTINNRPMYTYPELHQDLRDETMIKYDSNWNVTFQTKEVDMFDDTTLKGVWKARYHGCLEDSDDIKKRVAFVADTLEKAFAQSDKHPTVLKVFMIPECFFQGLYGAYIVDDASNLLSQLQKLVAPAKWKDWVFSFGTVNSVFESRPPGGFKQRSFEQRTELYEMRNHAPVIRGGLGDKEGFGETSTRMIQKLVNSAELADDLIVHPDAKRLQAINADVQFTDTDNDANAGKLLMRILDEDKKTQEPSKYFVGEGLPAEWWPQLVAALSPILHNWGLARLSRAIRVASNKNINGKPLKDWEFVGTAADVNKTSKIVSALDVLGLAVHSEWRKKYGDRDGNEWKTDPKARSEMMEIIIADTTTLPIGWGLQTTYQKESVKAALRKVKLELDSLVQKIQPTSPDFDAGKTTEVNIRGGDAYKELLKTKEELIDAEAKLPDLKKFLKLAQERSVSTKLDQQQRQAEEETAKQLQVQIEDLEKNPQKLEDEKNQLKDKIELLKVEEYKIEAVNSMASVMALAPPKQAPVSTVSVLPIWKKLLELYQKKFGGNAFQELLPENMVLEDYCFAGPRKVGPWFGSLGDLKGKDACKVMVFGLEICADHAAFRIKTINSGPDPVAIDIQLVPSAGMRPTYFAARTGGYLFNCDGWSKPIPTGGKNLTVHFDGPSPCKKDGAAHTPGFPHTGLAKNGGAVFSTTADCLVPAPHPVDAALAKVIFESGEGELHVYPVQDLPK